MDFGFKLRIKYKKSFLQNSEPFSKKRWTFYLEGGASAPTVTPGYGPVYACG